MSEPDQKQLLETALRALALLLMVSGVLVSTVPLESKRPADAERVRLSHAGRQDVDARLWQDPFVVMQRAKGETPAERCTEARKDGAHHPRTLARSIVRRNQRQSVTVLPVMVQGGLYFEDGESRRRARYAVVSALLRSGWEPSDEEKLGYIWTLASCIDNPWERLIPELLPWEWFSRKSPDMQHAGESLLILWVDEDALSKHPLRGMDAIVRTLACGGVPCLDPQTNSTCAAKARQLARHDSDRDKRWHALAADRSICTRIGEIDELATDHKGPRPLEHCRWSESRSSEGQPWCATRVLGPGTSEALQGLVRDLAELNREFKPEDAWLRFYSSGATAQLTSSIKQRLLQWAVEHSTDDRRSSTKSHAGGRGNTSQMAMSFLEEHLEKRLLRLTTTDDVLARAMVDELQLRLIDPNPLWRLLRGGRDAGFNDSTVVIISESDSLYARQFSQAICRASGQSDKPCQEDLAAEPGNQWPFRVVLKSYLRGLDGVLPEGAGAPVAAAQAPSQPANSPKEGLLTQAPRERADGRGQYDYLRRLAQDLGILDSMEKRAGRDGVRAIGVLGIDAYDRILVMEALRERFPKAIFFTADLDARMMGADVAKWTRNLVVASAYGLTLNPGIQGSTPPFRDSYQSGLYLSTLVALNPAQHPPDGCSSKGFESAQMFEIGRTHAIALSKGADSRCGDDDAQPCGCANLHRLDEWLTFPWPAWSSLIAVLLTTFAACALACLSCDSARAAAGRLWRMKWALARSGLLLVALAGWFLSLIWDDVRSHEGEPFEWLEGVSLWPTILLQLTTAGVILTLLWWYCLHRLSDDLDELARDFKLAGEPTGMPEQPGPPGGPIDRLRRLWWLDSPRAEGCHPTAALPRMNTAALWGQFRERMRWPQQIKRIACMSSLAFIFGIALLSLDWPHSPHRGAFAAWCQQFSFLLLLLALMAILFAVLDASSMARRFIRALDPRMAMPGGVGEAASPRTRSVLNEGAIGFRQCFRLVVKLGSTVKGLVYLPVIAFLLVLPARARVFDAWTLPPTYVLLLVLSTLLAVFCAVSLRRAAAEFRMRVLELIEQQCASGDLPADRPSTVSTRETGQSEASPTQTGAALISQIKGEIVAERQGPFVRLADDPVVQAILLLLGGTGAITTFQFLFTASG